MILIKQKVYSCRIMNVKLNHNKEVKCQQLHN